MEVVAILFSMVTILDAKSVVKLKDGEEQGMLLRKAERNCIDHMQFFPVPVDAIFCYRTWDNILCWDDTPAGTVALQRCPNYVNNFDTDAYATKECLENGTWYFSPVYNTTWTNFTQCSAAVPDKNDNLPEVPELIKAHMPRLRLMYSIGYSISLASLVTAVFLVLFFRKLHCQRNIIHLNLFGSFILKSVISLLRENILSEGGAFFSDDVTYDEYDQIRFGPGTQWECKLLLTSFHYVIGANYMWIFLEGLYLHMLVFVSYFTEKNKLKGYIIFGWGFPASFMIPWVLVRIHFEDVNCWTTNANAGFFWIIRGPIVASIIANFVFFVNIIRVLVIKLRASNNPETKKFRYRRLAKSTLVLIPLFGVHYMLFVAKPDEVDPTIELTWLYVELFINSFQGFMVSLLFCFLNGEVQAEVMKLWTRRGISRGGSVRSKTLTSLSSHWNRHRNNIEKRIQPRRCIFFRSKNGGASALQKEKRSNIISDEMSSAADRCMPPMEERFPLEIIKEIREELSKSSSKEESGQSDHNDNYNTFSLNEFKGDKCADGDPMLQR